MNPKAILAIATAVTAGGAYALEKLHERSVRKLQAKAIEELRLNNEIIAIRAAEAVVRDRIKRGRYNHAEEVVNDLRFEIIAQHNRWG